MTTLTARLTRDSDHRYFLGDRELPSVTQVLHDVGVIDYSDVPADRLERASDRGRAVHEAAWYDDEGQLDPATVSEVVQPYLTAWRTFRRDTGFTPVAREEVVYSLTHHYAGTLDRLVEAQGKLVLLDIKAVTSLRRSVGPQTAAYARAVREMGLGDPARRLAVQLKPDRTYVVTSLRDPTDWQVFAWALALYQWKRDHP